LVTETYFFTAQDMVVLNMVIDQLLIKHGIHSVWFFS